MTPRLAATLDKFQRIAEVWNARNPPLRDLLRRAFAHDLDRASDAIQRIEKEFDPGLAALAWSYFWIRQGEIHLAKNELESFDQKGPIKSVWGGLALMLLGELYVELGDTPKGARIIRRALQILEEPVA